MAASACCSPLLTSSVATVANAVCVGGDAIAIDLASPSLSHHHHHHHHPPSSRRSPHSPDASLHLRRHHISPKKSSFHPPQPAFPPSLHPRFRPPLPSVFLRRDGSIWDGPDDARDQPDAAKKSVWLKKGNSVLLSFIEEIEPLDVTYISNDASPDSMDAMKRTISGMLGLLPSEQFQVTIQTSNEPLAHLLLSSMMTGYTLRTAEYRLCLQKNLDLIDDQRVSVFEAHSRKGEDDETKIASNSEEDRLPSDAGHPLGEDPAKASKTPQDIGSWTPEAAEYVKELQSKLAEATKELEDYKRGKVGLEMGNLMEEEQNDLLNYLRSLEPDKVAELSRPTSEEVEEVFHKVIDSLLENLAIKKPKAWIDDYSRGIDGLGGRGWDVTADHSELLNSENRPIQLNILVTRDYLARLLFCITFWKTRFQWRPTCVAAFFLRCMLLGHYLKGLEYRLELSRTLRLSGDNIMPGIINQIPTDI